MKRAALFFLAMTVLYAAMLVGVGIGSGAVELGRRMG